MVVISVSSLLWLVVAAASFGSIVTYLMFRREIERDA